MQAAAEVLGAAYAAATPYEVVDHHVSRPSSTLALTTFPAAVMLSPRRCHSSWLRSTFVCRWCQVSLWFISQEGAEWGV
eukprot:COSAG04_NODE_20384_length_394_cov_4.440678_1_plen_78_part_10